MDGQSGIQWHITNKVSDRSNTLSVSHNDSKAQYYFPYQALFVDSQQVMHVHLVEKYSTLSLSRADGSPPHDLKPAVYRNDATSESPGPSCSCPMQNPDSTH